MKAKICILITAFVFMLMACSSPQKEAKEKLENMGITYNEETFFANVVAVKAEIVQLFLQAGMAPDVKEADKTALIEASRRAYTDIALHLINAGADVNAKDNYGTTPLIFAAISGSTEIMAALIDKGADVNAKDYMGRTALIEVFNSENEHTAEIIQTLIEAGADVNAKADFGNTAFIIAANTQYAKAFIDAGADVNAKNDEGKTALMRAIAYSNVQAVQILIEAGADVNAKDNYGVSCLVRAKDNPEISKILKEAGAKE